MKQIPSQEVKGKGSPYKGTGDGGRDERVPWIVGDGTLLHFSEKYDLLRRKNIVDIGCGNGKTLEYFKDSAESLAGIDLNNTLNEGIREAVDFHMIDLNFDPLPFDTRSKDLIFALQVIEHLENPFHVMREVHRVLEDGGLFIFSVPNPFSVTSKLRYAVFDNVRRWNLRNDHLLFLTKDVFEKTYGEYFDVIDTEYQKGLMPFVGRFYKLLGIEQTKSNVKILPRSKAFGDSVSYVLRKK